MAASIYKKIQAVISEAGKPEEIERWFKRV
jgi:hypothetical protein